jgi:hypothetical protein
MRSARTRAWRSRQRCAILMSVMLHRLPCSQPLRPGTEFKKCQPSIYARLHSVPTAAGVSRRRGRKRVGSSSSTPDPRLEGICLGLQRILSQICVPRAEPGDQGGPKLPRYTKGFGSMRKFATSEILGTQCFELFEISKHFDYERRRRL